MRGRGIKVWTVRVLAGLIGLVLLALLGVWLYVRASLAQLDGTITAPGVAAPVTVERDAHGVPLISGINRLDLAFATGYVHAQERFFQMDLLRRVGGGELAELFGARALPLDRGRRLHRFRARAELALKSMTAQDRAMLERYAAGVNAGLGALSAKPFEYALIGVGPRAWTAADSLLVVCAMYFDLQGKQEPRELARGWLLENASAEQRAFLLPAATEWDAPLDSPSVAASALPVPDSAPSWWGKPGPAKPALAIAGSVATPDILQPLRQPSVDFIDAVGSNNWVVAGSRSVGGGAIVSNDMHLGHQLPNIWYRLALQFPDASGKLRRIVGVSLPGAVPVVVAGSNGHVAWGFTNSNGDYIDLVALDRDPARPDQVRTPAGWEKVVVQHETILVKGAPVERLEVRVSSVGPIRDVAGRSYALHWTAHHPTALNLNPRRMETIDTLADALTAANGFGIPAQNFVAGDAKGNIGWTIAGLVPRRAQNGADTSFPIVDGATFDGMLAHGDYPRIENPADGQLATANSRQLMGPGSQLLGDGGFDVGARTRQIRDNLTALGARADEAGVYGVALDDRALFMAQWRERAVKVLDGAALEGHPQRAEFLRQLTTGWSGRASVESVGYRLARHFMWGLHDALYDGANRELALVDARANMALASTRWPVVVARLIDTQHAAWLPPGHADWRAFQLSVIDQVIVELTADGKPLAQATWGARNTAAIAHPIAAVAPFLKRWLAAPMDQLPGDANMPRVSGKDFGASERMAVQPGREEQGLFNMPGGQSGHPLSPFFLSGHAEWVRGKPLPLLPGAPVHTLRFVQAGR